MLEPVLDLVLLNFLKVLMSVIEVSENISVNPNSGASKQTCSVVAMLPSTVSTNWLV